MLARYGQLADARMMQGPLKSIMLNLEELLVPVALKLRHAHYPAVWIVFAHIADILILILAKSAADALNSC